MDLQYNLTDLCMRYCGSRISPHNMLYAGVWHDTVNLAVYCLPPVQRMVLSTFNIFFEVKHIAQKILPRL